MTEESLFLVTESYYSIIYWLVPLLIVGIALIVGLILTMMVVNETLKWKGSGSRTKFSEDFWSSNDDTQPIQFSAKSEDGNRILFSNGRLSVPIKKSRFWTG